MMLTGSRGSLLSAGGGGGGGTGLKGSLNRWTTEENLSFDGGSREDKMDTLVDGPFLHDSHSNSTGLSATNSILFTFWKKTLICIEIKDPPDRETLFSSIPHSTSLVSVSDPWKAFWADTAPFKGPRLSYELLPELQRNQDTVRSVALSAEVPVHLQKPRMKTLLVRLLKTQFFTPILDCEKST